MDYIGLGRRIKSARRERNITQEELSHAVGISLSFLGHIERGSRKASLETLIKLANELGESLDSLVRDSLTINEAQSSHALQATQGPAGASRAEESAVLSELSAFLGSKSGSGQDDWND